MDNIYEYKIQFILQSRNKDRVCGVMISVFSTSTVDHWFQPQSGQITYFTIDICCFSAKHTALRSKICWLCVLIEYIIIISSIVTCSPGVKALIVPSQESELSCICVLGYSFRSFLTLVYWFLEMWYFFHFITILLHKKVKYMVI